MKASTPKVDQRWQDEEDQVTRQEGDSFNPAYELNYLLGVRESVSKYYL